MKKLKTLYFLLLVLKLFTLNVSGYVITTPRKWSSEESNKVCVTLDTPATPEDSLNVGLKVKDSKDFILPLKPLPLVQGELSICANLALKNGHHTSGDLVLEGELGGVKLNYNKPIGITDIFKTFVQMDKALYMPLQTVQFRILSVYSSFLKVSTDQYEEIVIENPSGIRIAQWLNVSNSNGLIHKSFQLSDEPEEGVYKIKVRPTNRKIETRTFKVEEYELPKFEVTLNAPSYYLSNSKSLEIEVCAKYTFGQVVKGRLNLLIQYIAWYDILDTKNIIIDISGCKHVNITVDGSIEFYRMKLSTSVIEEGTNVEIKPKAKWIREWPSWYGGIQFYEKDGQTTFKPELPFIAEYQVTLPDDKPIAHETYEVCSLSICKNFTTNEKGMLKFVAPPHLREHVIINTPGYRKSFENKEYFSASGSSLSITLDDESIDCESSSHDIKFDVPVRFASKGQEKAIVSIQVISRGQIQFSKSFQQVFREGGPLLYDESLLLAPLLPSSAVRGSFSVPVSLPKFTSPKAKVVVWYTRKDGEVVADTKALNIAKCLLNDVNLAWSSKLSEPNDPAVLSLRAEPHSHCSLGVVDKSVELLASASNPLTLEGLFGVAELGSVQYNENQQRNDTKYCMDKEERKFAEGLRIIHPEPEIVRSYGVSSFRKYAAHDNDALRVFNEAGLYVFSNQILEARPCILEYGHLFGNVINPVLNEGKGHVTRLENPSGESKTRTYFPETWLWDLVNIADNGEVEKPLNLPDTVTEWVGSAVCVHPTKGIGLSNKASITTFQDFFIDLSLPSSIKVGETLPVKILVFNYLNESLPIRVVLEPSSEYEILPDSKTSEIAGERSSCVAAENKVVHTIRIKPTTAGDVNITVAAQVDINSTKSCGHSFGKARKDVIVKPIRVEFEGFEKESVQSKYICTNDIANEVDEMHSWILTPPSTIVPDSARGFVAVVGDMMGPTIENFGHLIKMPYGCGEQNMLNFAPNIFVMQYLESSNQKENAPVEKALKYMEKGYQRELNYRHEDGSFSAFGKADDSGSTWLTAFVLKCFAKAQNYISIDEHDLNVSRDWLKKLQQENGCFTSVGKVVHKSMKGGLSSAGDNSSTLLSSFVLISLIEAGQSTSDAVVRDALLCLKAEIDTDHPYSLAVLSYALALADSPDAVNVAQKLLSIATETATSFYWELPKNSSSSKSVAVETASYAVLTFLELNKKYPELNFMIHVPRILRWINRNRNGQGGFVSTQDTMVALQALAEFEKTVSQSQKDLTIFVKANEDETHFLVDKSNKFLQQKFPVSKFPADISFDLVGDGCVLLQALVRYNIPYPEPSETFNVTVETETSADNSCKTKNVKVCVSYLLEDQVSNMGIIEVKLVSGYIPKKEHLKSLVRSKEFKRYEIDGSLVTLYVDEFGHQPTCASFDILREVDVEKAKPGSVKVYDYYKPEYYITEKYDLPSAGECIPKSEAVKPVTIPSRGMSPELLNYNYYDYE